MWMCAEIGGYEKKKHKRAESQKNTGCYTSNDWNKNEGEKMEETSK